MAKKPIRPMLMPRSGLLYPRLWRAACRIVPSPPTVTITSQSSNALASSANSCPIPTKYSRTASDSKTRAPAPRSVFAARSAVGTAFSFFRFGIKKTVTKPHLYRDSCAFDTTASIVRCGRPSGCTHLRTCIRNSMFPSGPLMGEKSRPTAEKPF